ncbi:MAG: UDP-N-acetylmuramoyl-tripeptide--D-alanyl-D-alanine ligase [Nevskia sp.]|nr:UDP-N-acetylmuramoyl-tripeptide--D-alanyl-D-alanine ligase [Nevskia sp.]
MNAMARIEAATNPPLMEALSAVARRLGAQLLGPDQLFSRVVTDTRALRDGDLFVALVGERFDGHAFVLRAAALGAAGSVVAHAIEGAPAQIVAGDTLSALQNYAKSWRADFDLPVIGVTGSSGKTTTKQLLAAVLAARGPVLATEGNLNNHIGVPLTLLRLRAEHRTAVIEMGANHKGEIAQLAALAAPNIAIVTQAGDAHLEGFGSREGVARAKGELFAALEDGVAIINADDAYAPLWEKLATRAALLRFGFAAHADLRADAIELLPDSSRFKLLTPAGAADVVLPLPGRHNIANALAAAAAGIALNLTPAQIAQGLAQARPAAGRLSLKTTREGARLLDDSYNANPTSLRAAMELLATLPGQRWLVLGDMKELGTDAAALHAAAGREARALGIDRLYALGPLANNAADGFGNGRSFDTLEALVAALRAELTTEVSILIKGSRSSRMERVVAALGDPATAGADDSAH